MNLLSKASHFIKPGSMLKLSHKNFPYPPFCDLKLTHYDKDIIISEFCDRNNMFVQDGPVEQETHFYFPKKGTYKICVRYMSNIIGDDIDKCFNIQVA